MNKSDLHIHIIGAGLSGLTAALALEKQGYSATIIEANNTVGGRVQSEKIEGYILDRGFQVLLTSYPMAQKYLDLDALQLQKLEPGAAIFRGGKKQTIGDPLRELSFFLPTTFATVGSVTDKLKIFKLNKDLQKKSIEEIFATPEQSTLSYLQELGFSKTIIDNFFKPFFSGIFLEPELATSSRMFEFVYKMFGDGYAAIPLAGMQAISDQLANQLKQSTLRLNTAVQEVKGNSIILQDGTTLHSDYTIIATDPSGIVPSLQNQEVHWNSCDSLYFECSGKVLDKAIIGLIADPEALINNIFYPTSIPNATPIHHDLLSVTVVKQHGLTSEDLVAKVEQELHDLCGIKTERFLKQYTLKKALPKHNSLQYDCAATESKLTDTVFLAGDHLLNSSSNAAMLSGERAAEGLIKTIEGGLLA